VEIQPKLTLEEPQIVTSKLKLCCTCQHAEKYGKMPYGPQTYQDPLIKLMDKCNDNLNY